MNTASPCLCCLKRDVKLINLKSCSHSRFLRDLLANEIHDSSVVCFICHQTLKNVEQFRAQVLESQSLLETGNSDQKRKNKILNELGQSPVDITANEDSISMDIEIKSEADDDENLDSLHTEECIEPKTEKEILPHIENVHSSLEEGQVDFDTWGDPNIPGDPGSQSEPDDPDNFGEIDGPSDVDSLDIKSELMGQDDPLSRTDLKVKSDLISQGDNVKNDLISRGILMVKSKPISHLVKPLDDRKVEKIPDVLVKRDLIKGDLMVKSDFIRQGNRKVKSNLISQSDPKVKRVIDLNAQSDPKAKSDLVAQIVIEISDNEEKDAPTVRNVSKGHSVRVSTILPDPLVSTSNLQLQTPKKVYSRKKNTTPVSKPPTLVSTAINVSAVTNVPATMEVSAAKKVSATTEVTAVNTDRKFTEVIPFVQPTSQLFGAPVPSSSRFGNVKSNRLIVYNPQETKKPDKTKDEGVWENGVFVWASLDNDTVLDVELSPDKLKEERKKERRHPDYANYKFKCTTCILGFAHEQDLKDHQESVHTKKKENQVVCCICKVVQDTMFDYKEHYRKHFRTFQCTACDLRHKKRDVISKHFKQVHHADVTAVEDGRRCKECGFIALTTRELGIHKAKYHCQKRFYKCGFCDQEFLGKSRLLAHQLLIEDCSPRSAVYKCLACNKVYVYERALINHVLTRHKRSKAYCKSCQSYFEDTRNQHQQMDKRSRRGPVRRQCNQCVTLFKKEFMLVEKDNRIRKFVCDYCDEMFLSKLQIRRHIDRMHRVSLTDDHTMDTSDPEVLLGP